MLELACIVEGHGEVEAVPILLRRMVNEIDPALLLKTWPPIRVSRDKLKKPGELERAVELAARKTRGRGAVIVLIDSERDCPAKLGPELLTRATAARGDIPISVILAQMEFEAWFIAAAASLRGRCGLLDQITAPPEPESIRGAKEWLRKNMTKGRTYTETIDQPALCKMFDLPSARKARSFERCCREVARIVGELKKRG